MLPTPKFSIGAVVFAASDNEGRTVKECPDCRGLRKWTATSPAGETLDISCPRCCYRYTSDLPSLVERAWVPSTKTLTIGSVRLDTNDAEHPVSYMAQETGIGSGQIWYEDRIYATEAEALDAAQLECNRKAAEWAATPEAQRHALQVSLTFRDAFGERAAADLWGMAYHWKVLVTTITNYLAGGDAEESTLTEEQRLELQETIAGWNAEYHLNPRRNPLVALVLASRAVMRSPDLATRDVLLKALTSFDWLEPDDAEQSITDKEFRAVHGEREKGDDDGREYSDPRDARDERL